jgi:hypothetical protein
MLDNDVTAEFLNKFAVCFNPMVRSNDGIYIYESEY